MSDRGCGHADARVELGGLCLECFAARHGEPPPSAGVDAGKLKTLQDLLELDQRVREIPGRPVRVLAALDRAIAETATSLGSLNRAKIAREVSHATKISRSTVSRHLRRILADAGYLEHFGKAALGIEPKQDPHVQFALAVFLAKRGIGTITPPLTAEAIKKFALSVEDYNDLCRFRRAGLAARRRMRVCLECAMSWEKGKPPPRPVSPRATYCSDRCRQRAHRRRERYAARNPRP